MPSYVQTPSTDAPTCSADEIFTGTCTDPSTIASIPVNTTWWRDRLSRAPEKLAQDALVEAIEWAVETFGKDMSAWRWGTAHQTYYAHSNPKVRLDVFIMHWCDPFLSL